MANPSSIARAAIIVLVATAAALAVPTASAHVDVCHYNWSQGYNCRSLGSDVVHCHVVWYVPIVDCDGCPAQPVDCP